MKTWENSSVCAVERGGHLFEINDEAEQANVFDAIIYGAVVSPAYTASPDGTGVPYLRIGVTDGQTEGNLFMGWR